MTHISSSGAGEGRTALTQPQRSYLERLAITVIANVHVRSGASRKCLRLLMYRGYVDCVQMPDHRDNYWRITPAGRAALSAKDGR